MRRSSVRGEGAHYYRRSGYARDPRDLGWDDSLYEERPRGRRLPPPRRGGFVPNDDYDDGYYDDDDYYYDDDYWEPPRKKRRVLRFFAWVVALGILATAAGGYLWYRDLNNNLRKDELNLGQNRVDKKPPNAAGQTPLNILLLGSDSRGSKENQKLGGAKGDADRPPLADVQMLLHVSADRSNISVVSVPRDTLTKIPECKTKDGKTYEATTTNSINSSLQHGGPGCTVATWEEMTGIHIDHFMMVDFAGVVQMADAVGGVPVCVKNNIYDKQSHLRLKKGTTVVKGEQALQWLRTRHGFEDGSDIGRTHAQHQYMNSMVRELKAGAKLTDPGKLRSLATAATKALTVNEEIGSVKKLYDLANDIKKVPTDRITMTTMPWKSGAPEAPGRVRPKNPDADWIWNRLRSDQPIDGKDKKKKPSAPPAQAPPKGEVEVTVQNGTGTVTQVPVTGRAGAVADRMQDLGFTNTKSDTTRRSSADTTITYKGAEQRAGAQSVAKALGLPDQAVRESSQATGITLVVGADWRQGASYPKGKAEAYGGDKAPDSSNPLNAGDDKKACMDVYEPYIW
ncbi:LCP family protein [Streptomyces sp. A7024]|uniref:LCP family protein n=1 Tax=Streptomyces coryli TaxID=1128680 RepID=A0A6G4TZH8_9ACTN|nr:LCP family protein [Streptomyces coryli]NGN65385.1 LCP family protein [Streptomyces coryli]